MSYHRVGGKPLITHYQPPVQRIHAYGITKPAYGRQMVPGTSFGNFVSDQITAEKQHPESGLSGILAVL